MFEHAKFFTPHSKMWVQGSWIRHAYWTIQTCQGKLLKLGFDAHNPSFNGTTKRLDMDIDDVHFKYRQKVHLVVATPQWRIGATVTKGAPHWGTLRMDITIQPTYDIAAHGIWPHGILGQTYDADRVPLHGKRDKYSILDNGTPTASRKSIGGIVTTHAQGEGAIEGVAEMYRVKRPFDTKFAFSNFGATSAQPRNVSQIRGRRQP
jgi:hypothetical protein